MLKFPEISAADAFALVIPLQIELQLKQLQNCISLSIDTCLFGCVRLCWLLSALSYKHKQTSASMRKCLRFLLFIDIACEWKIAKQKHWTLRQQ